MSWSHCSRAALAGVLLVCVLAAAGVAGAVTVVSEDVPEEAQTGTTVTATVELEDLYENQSTWQLEGTTHLDDATWTIETYRNGEQLDTIEESGSSFFLDPWEEGDPDSPTRVVVEVSGEVPPIEDYDYEEGETVRIVDLLEVFDDGTNFWVIGDWTVPHSSEASEDARSAIDSAETTVQEERESGTDVSTAESTLEDAIAAYDDGDLDEAVSLAEQAETEATEGADESDGSDQDGDTDGSDGETDESESDGSESDGSDSEGTDADGNESDGDDGDSGDGGADDSDDGGGGLLSLILGVVVLGLLAGGGYWYYQQQQGPSRDPLG